MLLVNGLHIAVTPPPSLATATEAVATFQVQPSRSSLPARGASDLRESRRARGSAPALAVAPGATRSSNNNNNNSASTSTSTYSRLLTSALFFVATWAAKAALWQLQEEEEEEERRRHQRRPTRRKRRRRRLRACLRPLPPPLSSPPLTTILVRFHLENGAEADRRDPGPRSHVPVPVHALESSPPAGHVVRQLADIRVDHHPHHHRQLRGDGSGRQTAERGQDDSVAQNGRNDKKNANCFFTMIVEFKCH